MWGTVAIGIPLMLACASLATAADDQRALSQYLRDEWGADRGYPGGPVYAIAQTTDGYLWIAAEKGLVRFDGLTFKLFQPSGTSPGTGPTVLGIAADADGSLWARLRGPALVRYRQRAFELVSASNDRREWVISAMTHGADGAVLLAPLGLGAVAHRHGRFEAITAEGALASSFVLAMAQSPGGDIWLGTRDAGLVRVHGGATTPVTAGLPDQKVNCLLAGPADQLLIGTDRGVARWTGAVVTTAGVPAALASIPALGMIRDRASNVWIAAGPRGLLRLSGERVSGLDDPAVRPVPMVAAVFEDREGNIWYGTSRGIGRLRETVFTTYTAAQGLPSDAIGPVYADDAGRTWFAAADGLFQLDGTRVERIAEGGLGDDVVYSIAGRGDEVWVGRQQGGLTHIRMRGDTRRATGFTQADGLAQNNVFAVQLARDGAVWAGTLSGGVSRYKDGSFTTFTVDDGLASNTVAAIAEAADGTLWFGTPNGVSTLGRRHMAAPAARERPAFE